MLLLEQLLEVEDIGPSGAENILHFFAEPANIAVINDLMDRGVVWDEGTGTSDQELPLNGLTFVLTGTLPTLSRDEASDIIRKAGGKVSGSVSKKTSYVLAGESAGSKLAKAESLGVNIIDEPELFKMINQGVKADG